MHLYCNTHGIRLGESGYCERCLASLSDPARALAGEPNVCGHCFYHVGQQEGIMGETATASCPAQWRCPKCERWNLYTEPVEVFPLPPQSNDRIECVAHAWQVAQKAGKP